MILRTINNVEIEVDLLEGDAIYLTEEDLNNLDELDIESIISYIYEKGNSEYIPLSMTIELTNKCNYNCPFCYINTNNARSVPAKFYRFKDIKNDLEWLIKKGLLYCTITGGEPLLHPDFKEIYMFLKENGVLINLFTNLSLLKDELLELILKYQPLKLETTMYAYSDLEYEKITGQTIFTAEDFKASVLNLKRQGINIICKTPLNSITIKEFRRCQEWCKKNNIEYFYSENISNTYDGVDLQHCGLKQAEKTGIINERIKDAEMLNIAQFGEKEAFNCGAGKFACFISYDYCLRPCMDFNEIKSAIINIEFNKIEEAFRKMLEFINFYKGKRLTFCSGCRAKNICKICIIDEIKYLENGTDYRELCGNNKHIMKKIINN